MVLTTLTGLVPARRKPLPRQKKPPNISLDFKECIQPVPYILKPFSTVYNPYRYGCSVFCNHPAESEIKTYITKTTSRRGKKSQTRFYDDKRFAEKLGHCLEGMMERYSTSTPGGLMFGSGAPLELKRKCLTPDPGSVGAIPQPPRQRLVLDLRRSHSQETLSTNMPGRAATEMSGDVQSSAMSATPSSMSGATAAPGKTSYKLPPPPPPPPSQLTEAPDEPKSIAEEPKEEEEDVPRRRGRKLKKKKKMVASQASDVGKEVTGIVEPGETQVSAYLDVSGGNTRQGSVEGGTTPPPSYMPNTPRLLETSFFGYEILKHLRRNMSREDAEGELRLIWRRVLTEALRACATSPEEQMKHVKEELKIPESGQKKWLALPRVFTFDSARFELPLDRSRLNGMTSQQYLKEFVAVSKVCRQLYSCVFHENKTQDSENEGSNSFEYIPGSELISALGQVMGRAFKEEETTLLKQHIDWSDEDRIGLRAWFGICAATERLLCKKFSYQEDQEYKTKPEIEIADFESLSRRLTNVQPHPTLLKLLLAIRDTK